MGTNTPKPRKRSDTFASNPGNRGKGRPKGSTNKLTACAKEAIQLAFDELGGVARLVEWAKENNDNLTLFYVNIYPKLIPQEIKNPDGHSFAVTIVTQIVPNATDSQAVPALPQAG